MGAMKPRTESGPMEVTKEARSYVMRVPMQDGGRLVVALGPDEALSLGRLLVQQATSPEADPPTSADSGDARPA